MRTPKEVGIFHREDGKAGLTYRAGTWQAGGLEVSTHNAREGYTTKSLHDCTREDAADCADDRVTERSQGGSHLSSLG